MAAPVSRSATPYLTGNPSHKHLERRVSEPNLHSKYFIWPDCSKIRESLKRDFINPLRGRIKVKPQNNSGPGSEGKQLPEFKRQPSGELPPPFERQPKPEFPTSYPRFNPEELKDPSSAKLPENSQPPQSPVQLNRSPFTTPDEPLPPLELEAASSSSLQQLNLASLPLVRLKSEFPSPTDLPFIPPLALPMGRASPPHAPTSPVDSEHAYRPSSRSVSLGEPDLDIPELRFLPSYARQLSPYPPEDPIPVFAVPESPPS